MKFLSTILALSFTLAIPAPAQTTTLKPELPLYHPSTPLSYEVASIKPLDPDSVKKQLKLLRPSIPNFLNPLSIRNYIMDAYGAIYPDQIVGGPDWLARNSYRVSAKPSGELEAALRNMKRTDALDRDRAMQQSLLADRFHLKAHFETRDLPVYELMAARDGLKIAAVAAPLEQKPDSSPPPPPRRCGGLYAGETRASTTSNDLQVLNACDITMQDLARYISWSAAPELDSRPIINHTGFTGYFDIKNFVWAPLSWNGNVNPGAHFLQPTLEDRLGIELIRTHAPVEVLVIDSIDRPTED